MSEPTAPYTPIPAPAPPAGGAEKHEATLPKLQCGRDLDGDDRELSASWIKSLRHSADVAVAHGGPEIFAAPEKILDLLSHIEFLDDQAATLRARLATEQASAAEAEREKLELHEELRKQNRKLFEALAALAGMWNQYCPPAPADAAYRAPGHMFMSAGEDAEDVLSGWGLMRKDETAIDPDWGDDLAEAPAAVRALIGLPAAENEAAASPVGKEPGAGCVRCGQMCGGECEEDGRWWDGPLVTCPICKGEGANLMRCDACENTGKVPASEGKEAQGD